MKKLITVCVLVAGMVSASFALPSFADVKKDKKINDYLQQKLEEAKAKADEENDYEFAPWQFGAKEYAQALRDEVTAVKIRSSALYYITSEYRASLEKDSEKKNTFASAKAYYDNLMLIPSSDDKNIIFYVLTVYDVNRMDGKAEVTKFLGGAEERLKTFDERKAFSDKKQREKLVYVMKRFKRLNQYLKQSPYGGGDEFVEFCALMSYVFK